MAPGHDTSFAIKAQALNVYYGNFHAVRDVNLSIERKQDHIDDRPVWVWQEPPYCAVLTA